MLEEVDHVVESAVLLAVDCNFKGLVAWVEGSSVLPEDCELLDGFVLLHSLVLAVLQLRLFKETTAYLRKVLSLEDTLRYILLLLLLLLDLVQVLNDHVRKDPWDQLVKLFQVVHDAQSVHFFVELRPEVLDNVLAVRVATGLTCILFLLEYPQKLFLEVENRLLLAFGFEVFSLDRSVGDEALDVLDRVVLFTT